MSKLTLGQLASYAADELERGTLPSSISQGVAAVLISQHSSQDVLKFGRALESELANRGVTQVTITSALKLEQSTKLRLAKSIGVDRPLFHDVIDESIINGARVETSDKQLDLTVERKLVQLKQSVMESRYE